MAEAWVQETSTAPSMISAIVCTYNRCESLRDTLRGLQAQQTRGGLQTEIVVVDNNSADHTRDVVEEAMRHGPWPMRYVFEPRQGISHARNRGIREAHGDIVAFTDDDVVADADWVQALYNAMTVHEADCVGGKIVPLWMQAPPKWLEEAITHRRFLAVYSLLDLGPELIVAAHPEQGVAYGANIAFRKAIFSEMGVFSSDLGLRGMLHLVGEDTEMIERVVRAGKRVVYTPHAVVHHKIGPERMKKSYIRQWKYYQGLSQGISASRTESYFQRVFEFGRACCYDGLRALVAYGRGLWDLGIVYEASFWTHLGRVVGMAKLLRQAAGQVGH